MSVGQMFFCCDFICCLFKLVPKEPRLESSQQPGEVLRLRVGLAAVERLFRVWCLGGGAHDRDPASSTMVLSKLSGFMSVVVIVARREAEVEGCLSPGLPVLKLAKDGL